MANKSNDDKKINNDVVEKRTKKMVNEKEKKSVVSRVINIVLWIVVVVWIAICLYDFYNVHQNKEPVFCLKKETTVYSDGTVESCLGLGYKVYDYNRTSFTAIEFGPFWTKDRSAEEDN